MQKKLLKHSKLTNKKIGKLIQMFVLEVPASKAAVVLKINRNTAQRIYTRIRISIVKYCESTSPFSGEVEVDESYFGGKRKGNRGRGAGSKVPVFGILRRNGKVYTKIVKDVSGKTLKDIIRNKVDTDSIIYSDSFRSYDGLVAYGYKHKRINHAKKFGIKNNHINGIENFWGFAKTKLRRYNGIDRKHFFLYLKEMEFRFNYRNTDLTNKIKEIITI
jgi:transposase